MRYFLPESFMVILWKMSEHESRRRQYNLFVISQEPTAIVCFTYTTNYSLGYSFRCSSTISHCGSRAFSNIPFYLTLNTMHGAEQLWCRIMLCLFLARSLPCACNSMYIILCANKARSKRIRIDNNLDNQQERVTFSGQITHYTCVLRWLTINLLPVYQVRIVTHCKSV